MILLSFASLTIGLLWFIYLTSINEAYLLFLTLSKGFWLWFVSLTIDLLWFIWLLRINVAYLLLLNLSEGGMRILNLSKQWQRMCIFTDKGWRWIKWREAHALFLIFILTKSLSIINVRHALFLVKAFLLSFFYYSPDFLPWKPALFQQYLHLGCKCRREPTLITSSCFVDFSEFYFYPCHFSSMERATKPRLAFLRRTHVNISSSFPSNFHIYKARL
jgi:hypothetical protein